MIWTREATLVAIDLETTGFDPATGDRITEVGLAWMRGGGVYMTTSLLVDPDRPIPAEVVELTGITDDMVRGRPRLTDVGELLLAAIVQADGVVGFNWPFEQKFLAHELGMEWMRRVMARPLLDAQLVAYQDSVSRWWHGRSRRSLQGLTKWLGIHHAPHRADHDAEAALAVLWELRTHLPEDLRAASEYLEQQRPAIEARVAADRAAEKAAREAQAAQVAPVAAGVAS